MDIRKKYINFFKAKDHEYIKSAPVVPLNDTSVLFNTAGMLQFVPYLMGEKKSKTNKVVNYQMCIRTNDLDEVGDLTHHTFFEMLGNWSFGDYFKEESINYSYEFLTNELNIPHDKLAVTCFIGNDDIPKDMESYNAWKNLGFSDDKIRFLNEDNFWIAGDTGPCGGDTEIFYWRSDEEVPKEFDTEDERWVEIWNNVFMEYYKHKDGSVTQLEQKNVDTGMGLERIVSVLEGVDDNYLSSLWTNSLKKLEELSNLSYEGNETSMRIIMDHIKAAVFILADESNVVPSNTNQGYVLRRIIRRLIRHARRLNIDLNSNFEEELAIIIINDFKEYYPHLTLREKHIFKELKDEKIRFSRTLDKGLKEFNKIINDAFRKEFLNDEVINKKIKELRTSHLNFMRDNKEEFKHILNTMKIDAENSFKLYDTYGFPIELTKELASDFFMKIDEEGFRKQFKKHQERSRQGGKELFTKTKEDLEMERKHHTAAHLLHSALREVLGDHATQRGQHINKNRLRFDFNNDKKVSDENLVKIENLVNKWIKEELDVTKEEMAKEEALKLPEVDSLFADRYPDVVTIYSIGEISKELCGGPHVNNTKELGNFEIIKEEASSSGVRRIRAKVK